MSENCADIYISNIELGFWSNINIVYLFCDERNKNKSKTYG